MTRSTPAQAVPLGIVGAGALALSGLYFVNPNTTHVPLCPLHALTGLNCPFCGATRATYALLHGDLMTALHDNALLVASIPLLLVLWYRWFSDARSGTERRLVPRPVGYALLVLVLAFGVARNLPFGHWLAPPA